MMDENTSRWITKHEGRISALERKRNDTITLRDFFAQKAMDHVPWIEGSFDEGAESAYRIADAMLKARGNDEM